MSKKEFEIRKQDILPGFEEGRFEPRRVYERGEFQSSFEDGLKRDNRVSIKISGRDLEALKKTALDQGIPLQTLLSQIIHQYASSEDLGDALDGGTVPDDGETLEFPLHFGPAPE